MIARPIAPLVVVAVLAVAVAGCGGGSSAEASLSKPEYVKRATKICKEAREDNLARVAAYVKEQQGSGRKGSQLLLATFKAVALKTIEGEIAALRKLEPPEGDEARINAFLDAEQRAVEEARRLRRAGSTAQMESYFTPSARIAKAYGILACGNSAQVNE